MSALSLLMAWLLAGTAGVWEYAGSHPASATEIAGLKSVLCQLGKLKNSSYETI